MMAIGWTFFNKNCRTTFNELGMQLAVALLIIALFYAWLVKAFPFLGLIDVRAVPQVMLFFGLFLGVFLGIWFDTLGKMGRFTLGFVIVIPVIWFSLNCISFIKHNLSDNWSGWSTKAEYSNFMKLNNIVRAYPNK